MRAQKLKTLNCKECGRQVQNVGEDAVAVICSKCVQESLRCCIKIEETDENKESFNNNLKTNDHEI